MAGVEKSLERIENNNKELREKLQTTAQAVDLSLLTVINNKLGNQLTGGLSGFLTDRFTKLWESRVIDRGINLVTMATSIHNAAMLSRNLADTLTVVIGNVLTLICIKDGDGVAKSINDAIGSTIENLIKGLIGSSNYTQLTETWAKANRIYQATTNIWQLTQDSFFAVAEGLEVVGQYNARIGNALKASGEVLENSYNWMSETINFHANRAKGIKAVIDNLQAANTVASDLAEITGEFREASENIAEIKTQVDALKAEVATKEDEKKTAKDAAKAASNSPDINKSDLKKP
jgi:hypothetical protein